MKAIAFCTVFVAVVAIGFAPTVSADTPDQVVEACLAEEPSQSCSDAAYAWATDTATDAPGLVWDVLERVALAP